MGEKKERKEGKCGEGVWEGGWEEEEEEEE